jgi:hypothetical protein
MAGAGPFVGPNVGQQLDRRYLDHAALVFSQPPAPAKAHESSHIH